MRFRMSLPAFLTSAILAASCPALAQIAAAPALMNFQGRLTTPTGVPVADGNNYSVTVSLWDAATGGNQKWTQTLNSVTVTGGIFSTLLTPDTGGLFNGAGLWLQIQVGSDPAMTPRQQLASVPFAMKANTVPDASIASSQLGTDAASLGKVSGGLLNINGNNVGVGTSTPDFRFHVRDTQNLVEHVESDSTIGTWMDLTNSSTGGQTWHLISAGSANGEGAGSFFIAPGTPGVANGASMTFLPNHNVGVGTTTPGMSLEVANPTYYSAPALGVGSASKWLYLHAGVTDPSLIWNNGLALRFGAETTRGVGYAEKMRVGSNGNVGIGTTAPGQKLSVAGVVESTTGGFKFPDGTTQTTASAGAGPWINQGSSIYNTTPGVVGIGTSTPSASLDISTTDQLTSIFESPSATGTWLQLTNTSKTGSTRVGNDWSLVSTGSANGEGPGSLAFYNGQTGGTKMLLDSQGRLGLGTNAVERLEVNGRIAFVPKSGDETNAGKLDYRGFDTNAFSIIGAGTTSGNRSVRIFDNLSVGYPAATSGIGAIINGKVGIGTQLPSNTLDVNGTVEMNGFQLDGVTTAGNILTTDASGVGTWQPNPAALWAATGGSIHNTNTSYVGIGTSSPQTRLDVFGDVNAAGNVYAHGVQLTSDARFKTNVSTLSNSLDAVLSLRGVSFDWKRNDFPQMGFPSGRQIGFIAQEVEKVLPEVVQTGPSGSKSVAYQNIVPVVVEAMKEQQRQLEEKDSQITALQQQNAAMEQRLKRLEQAIGSGTSVSRR